MSHVSKLTRDCLFWKEVWQLWLSSRKWCLVDAGVGVMRYIDLEKGAILIPVCT
jgi:hypothetical protein